MGTPFKDHYGRDHVERTAARMARLLDAPRPDTELDAVVAQLAPLEMKARASALAAWIETVFADHPLGPIEAAVAMVTLDPPWSGFDVWPATLVVERLGPEAVERALPALYTLTQHFTGEFAIRPLLLAHPERVFAELHTWVHDPSDHVRRLVSEGTRTRLPWGVRLQPLIDDPRPVLPLLEALRDDPSEYVRRSVANHLNDLSRDHPALVVGIAARWWSEGDANRRALVRHALRTRIKAGDPDALAIVGAEPARVQVTSFALDATNVAVGESVTWQAVVASAADVVQSLIVDVRLHLVRARGRTGVKVFKGARVELAAGDVATVRRTLSFREVTVRRYYPGLHRLELMINGDVVASCAFELHTEA